MTLGNWMRRTLGVVMVFGFAIATARAEISPSQIMDREFGKFSKRHQCWYARSRKSEERYCMRIDRSDRIEVDGKSLLYVLAVGSVVDSHGEPQESMGTYQSTGGLVAAYVAESDQGKLKIISRQSGILLGTWGDPPKQWKFVKLGSKDKWGWQNVTEPECHQGDCSSVHSLLVPCGQKIVDAAVFFASFKLPAMSTQYIHQEEESFEMDLQVDSSDVTASYFPILLIGKGGTKNGKRLEPRTWKIPFDVSQCSYPLPKDIQPYYP